MCTGICYSFITCWAYWFQGSRGVFDFGPSHLCAWTVLFWGVVNIGISSLGSICKQWKGYLVASSSKRMLAWGVTAAVYSHKPDRSQSWSLASLWWKWGKWELLRWPLYDCFGLNPAFLQEQLIPPQPSTVCTKALLHLRFLYQGHKVFRLFFFFYLSMLKRFICIQKS